MSGSRYRANPTYGYRRRQNRPIANIEPQNKEQQNFEVFYFIIRYSAV
jgi:hypothetical protein